MKSKAILITVIVLMMSSFAGATFAQDDAPPSPDRQSQQRNLLRGAINAVTEATGLTVEEIRAELQNGVTLAEIVEANGGNVDEIITGIETQISERLDTLFNTQLPAGERAESIREIVDAVSEATGLEATEIAQAVRDGSTVVELIEANGNDVEDVIATATEIITNAINERVENGQLTQERADIMLENLDATITDWVNGELEREGRGRGNRDNRGNRD